MGPGPKLDTLDTRVLPAATSGRLHTGGGEIDPVKAAVRTAGAAVARLVVAAGKVDVEDVGGRGRRARCPAEGPSEGENPQREVWNID